jgi:F0F1-type ATP synthase assembly protein I
MKKISLGGVILGVVLGVVVATISGTWILWLSGGLALGMLIGVAAVRRDQLNPRAKSRELRA